jgi:hypothetical protein
MIEKSTDAHLYAMQGLALARGLPVPSDLRGLDVFLPYLEELQNEGLVFVLQLGSSPDNGEAERYVASIDAGLLGGERHIEIIDASMSAAVAGAILEYARRYWHFDW